MTTYSSLKLAMPVLAVLLAAGCSDRDRAKTEAEARQAGRTAERKVDNAAMTTAVKAKLAADVRLSTITSIDVDSNVDTVTLTGHVPTSADKQKAEDVAKSVDGVTRVINNLTVAP